jgi:hypothetical protein
MIPLCFVYGAAAEPLELPGGLRFEPHGFVDVGWFDVQGTGASYRFDHTTADGTWIYTGDPWAAAINAQGDPADLDNERDNLEREDPIDSDGKPTFLVNTVELAARLKGEQADVEVGVWFEPRSGTLGDLGDIVSVDRAFVTWHPRADRDFELRVGKMESMFGIEWYQRRAPERPNVTPSLIARYTTGTPVGVGVHVVPSDLLTVDAQLTNGGTSTERFGHVENELDTNGVPTGTAHVELRPLRSSVLRIGASGQAGAQDGVAEVVPMWQIGGDIALDLALFYVRGEVLLSDQDQGDPAVHEQLSAFGWMVQAWGTPLPWLAPFVRLDRRIATLSVPEPYDNLYDSDVMRLTGAVQIDATSYVAVRAELSHLWELGGELVTEPKPIPDDVLTTSVVFDW